MKRHEWPSLRTRPLPETHYEKPQPLPCPRCGRPMASVNVVDEMCFVCKEKRRDEIHRRARREQQERMHHMVKHRRRQNVSEAYFAALTAE